MSEIKRILVPLDGSIAAEVALKPALELANHLGAEVALVRVVPTLSLLTPYLQVDVQFKDLHKTQRSQANGYLRGLRLYNLNQTVSVKSEVLTGRPATAIIEYARQNNIDLIVMSSHGRSGVGRFRHGSVALQLMSGAPCSTLIVRANKDHQPLLFRRLLIPLDGSEKAEGAVEPAVTLANTVGAESILSRVTAPLAPALGEEQAEALRPQLQKQVEQYLAKVRSKWSGIQPGIKTQVDSGPVARTILQQAQAHEVDLIVLSAHGGSGSNQPLGTVTDKVVRGARRAVLVVR